MNVAMIRVPQDEILNSYVHRVYSHPLPSWSTRRYTNVVDSNEKEIDVLTTDRGQMLILVNKKIPSQRLQQARCGKMRAIYRLPHNSGVLHAIFLYSILFFSYARKNVYCYYYYSFGM